MGCSSKKYFQLTNAAPSVRLSDLVSSYSGSVFIVFKEDASAANKRVEFELPDGSAVETGFIVEIKNLFSDRTKDVIVSGPQLIDHDVAFNVEMEHCTEFMWDGQQWLLV